MKRTVKRCQGMATISFTNFSFINAPLKTPHARKVHPSLTGTVHITTAVGVTLARGQVTWAGGNLSVVGVTILSLRQEAFNTLQA